MQYSYLGKSGLKVSRICLGTMNFGPATDEKEAFRIMDAALDAGVNFLIPLTSTAGERIPVLPKKLSDAGSTKVVADVRKWFWPPKSMAPCMMIQTAPTTKLASPPTKSDGIWRVPSAVYRRIISSYTRCIM